MASKLRILQIEETKMLKELIDFFSANNIRYFALAGTFLGSVRHKGFVPWDDDIDVGVPRPDYDKLIALTKKNKKIGSMYVEYLYHDFSILHYPLRVVNPKLIMRINKFGSTIDMPTWITLFPLDGMPNNSFKRYIHSKILLYRRFCYVIARYTDMVDPNHHKFKGIKKILVKGVGELKIYKLFDKKKTAIKMDKSLKKYSYDESDYILTLMGGYKLKEMFPKKVFGKGKKYKFEDIELIGPKDYEKYLTQIYGDWRTPPPIDHPERNHHGLIDVICN